MSDRTTTYPETDVDGRGGTVAMTDAGLPRPRQVEDDPFGAGTAAPSDATNEDGERSIEVDDGSYAHARAQDPIADDEDEDALDDELATIKQVLSQLRVTINRYLWWAAGQRRVRRMGAALRAVALDVLGCRTRRTKRHGVWSIYAVDVDGTERLAVEVTVSTRGRTLDDLRAPIAVVVHAPELVESSRLTQMMWRGEITIEMRKVAA